MSKAKEIISKKIINPIKSVGKSMSMPKLFSFGVIPQIDALPTLYSIPNRGLMAHSQVEQHYKAICP